MSDSPGSNSWISSSLISWSVTLVRDHTPRHFLVLTGGIVVMWMVIDRRGHVCLPLSLVMIELGETSSWWCWPHQAAHQAAFYKRKWWIELSIISIAIIWNNKIWNVMFELTCAYSWVKSERTLWRECSDEYRNLSYTPLVRGVSLVQWNLWEENSHGTEKLR